MRVVQRVSNRLQDRVKVEQDLVIPETKHPVTLLAQKFRTSRIEPSLTGMVATIKLHNETMF